MPRPFAYNPTRDPIDGCEQVNDLAIGVDEQDYSGQPGGVVWWMGPEEDTHVIAAPVPAGNKSTPVGDVGTVEFWKTISLTDEAFMQLATQLSGQFFENVGAAFIWFRANGYWTSLDLRLGTSIYAFGDFISLMEPGLNGIAKLAPNGSQDATWKTNGGFYLGEAVEALAYIPLGMLELTDSSLLVYGNHATYDGEYSTKLTRISSVDASLISSPAVNADQPITNAIELPDGTVLFGGQFTYFAGGSRKGVCRYNLSTNLVPFEFNSWDNIMQGTPTEITDMKLVVADNGFGDFDWIVFMSGNFQTSNAGNRKVIAIDAKTGGNASNAMNPAIVATQFNNRVAKIFPISRNELIAIGNFTSYRGQSYAGFVRTVWNNDAYTETVTGNTGTGFKLDGSTTNAIIYDAVRLTNGKVIVVGNFNSYNGVACSGIIQLNANGSLDAGYASVIPSGIIGYAIVLDADERPIIHINSDTYGAYSVYKLIKLAENGTYDVTFSQGKAFIHRGFPDTDTPIIGKGSIVNSLYLNRAQDAIWAIGPLRVYNPSSSISLGRVTNTYAQDARFSTGSGFNGPVNAAFPDPSDGSLYVGGSFTSYNGTALGGITKLGLDGAIDQTAIFNYGTGFSLNGGAPRINVILVQEDGQILIGGAFDSYKGSPSYNIVRLNPDGTKEPKTTFWLNTENAPGSGIFQDGPLIGEVFALAVDGNGNIAIGGNFTEIWGYSLQNQQLIKASPDGLEMYLDGTPNGTGAIYSVFFDDLNRLYAGGTFNQVGGSFNSNNVMLYNADGSNRYRSFNGITGGGNIVRVMKVLSTGKIAIGGKFEKGFRMYTANGQVDNTFQLGNSGFKKYDRTTGLTTDGTVFDILENEDGSITVCGDFNLYDDVPAYGMYKFNTDGSMSNSWNRYDFTIPSSGDTPTVRKMLKYVKV